MFKNLIVSVRPRQWYKNVLLLVSIVFSYNILDAVMWGTVLLGFIYFCMLSAGEYLINDVIDSDRDRAHPTKRQRPIASGQLNSNLALILALGLIASALAASYFTINLNFLMIAAAYVILIIAYSLFLKHVVIADVLVISTGFVIRAAAGALAIEVVVSPWLIVCTFLLALFLALEKRWYEIKTLAEESGNHRPSLAGYSPAILDQMISITTGALIVCYLLYTASVENEAMLITTPFAIYGLFRYLYLVREKGIPAEPDAVFKDKAMLANLGLWMLIVLSIILFNVPD